LGFQRFFGGKCSFFIEAVPKLQFWNRIYYITNYANAIFSGGKKTATKVASEN
jgi:hypothetical protein